MNRLVSIAAAVALLSVGCKRETASLPEGAHLSPQARVDVAQHMIQYGCPTCHVIPGVPGAVGKVGPSLDELRQRSYLAGNLPNTPQNLALWIMHPQHFEPGTAMPEMNVSAEDARQFAAFLEPAD